MQLLSLQTAPDGWKNSVRHNLSLNKCFEKVENKTSSSSRKGCLWALNPAKIDKMEEEMQKWKRKDLPAIRRSMANPGQKVYVVYCHRVTAWPGRKSSEYNNLHIPLQMSWTNWSQTAQRTADVRL